MKNWCKTGNRRKGNVLKNSRIFTACLICSHHNGSCPLKEPRYRNSYRELILNRQILWDLALRWANRQEPGILPLPTAAVEKNTWLLQQLHIVCVFIQKFSCSLRFGRIWDFWNCGPLGLCLTLMGIVLGAAALKVPWIWQDSLPDYKAGKGWREKGVCLFFKKLRQ